MSAPGRPLGLLIVDDEPPAVERLQLLAAGMEDVRVLGTAAGGEGALRLVEALAPDCVLLDVEMPGMAGIEVARRLDQLVPSPSVVFVTAYPDFAVAAFETMAVDYLLKPVPRERLARALERVRRRRLAGPSTARTSWLEAFWVSARGGMERVDARDIERIEAERDYMRLHAPALGRSWLIHETISELEARLDPECFVRVHRSTIVALPAARRLVHDGQGNWSVELGSGALCRIGRTHLAQAKARLLGVEQPGP